MADRERVSAALRARLGDAVLPAEAGATTSLLTRSAWAKFSAATAAVGIAGGLVFLGWPSSETSAPRVAAHEVQVAALSQNPPASAAAPAEPTVEPVSNASSEPGLTIAKRQGDRLAQEVAILSRATSQLHSGHPLAALKAVEEHQRKFPNGLLSEERRAARVQALCALGRRREAEPELQRLSRVAPHSANTLRAKQLCGDN
jgi:hypothetical protein